MSNLSEYIAGTRPNDASSYLKIDRILGVMPHPERCFRSVQYSWRARGLGEDSPWMEMFRNARRWVG